MNDLGSNRAQGLYNLTEVDAIHEALSMFDEYELDIRYDGHYSVIIGNLEVVYEVDRHIIYPQIARWNGQKDEALTEYFRKKYIEEETLI